MKITVSNATAVLDEALKKIGIDTENREIITDTILFANQRGVATHGIGRLPLYIQKVQTGHLNPKDEVETILDHSAIALLDAHNCFGQVAAYKATRIAISKAKKYGISAVGVRNSNNFGTAGYFGDLAARDGFAAMVYANAAPAIAPTGGTKTIFGTNPICYAFPCGAGEDPILLDMATTVAARGKIRLAAKNGEKIPKDWAIGTDGMPTDDPNEALKGSLLPIGGYKGYGLAMFVDLFAGLLTGSSHGGKVKNLSRMDEDSGNGHLFIIIDVQRFLDSSEIKDLTSQFRAAVKQCGPAGMVFMPGEKEYLHRAEEAAIFSISKQQFEDINKALTSIGVTPLTGLEN